jgi:oligoendopeptidase F
MFELERPDIIKKPRHFLPENFSFSDWNGLEPFYEGLKSRHINSADELIQWLTDWSELESYLSEDSAWRYINFTRNTEDEEAKKKYLFVINEIKPKIAPYAHELDKKFSASPFLDGLKDEAFKIYIRSVRNEVDLYREENIPLYTKAEEEAQKYADLVSQMTIHYNGQEYTLAQAAKFMKDTDRNVRKEVYDMINERRMQDRDALDLLFDALVKIRHQIALNAGFKNYRDYKFKALGRFDYTQEDVYNFHTSVKEEIVPIVNDIIAKKKEALKVDVLRPYDLDAETTGKPALRPYENSRELVEKTIKCFEKLHPILGDYIKIMDDKGYLDLESRKGKAPGGYNYPLDEIGIPFIFMNSSGKFRDLVTMLHEGGHAIHSFLTRNLELNAFKHTPSEVAELASMSMELISMDAWDVFFDNPDDLKRAKWEQLEGIIEILPWIASVDKFQNWIYTNPEHTHAERTAEWVKIFNEFHSDITDWEGYAKYKEIAWQKQLHIFEVPFYYIEYGIAQLGALAVWKNCKKDPAKGLQQYVEALKLGYTRPVPEIYKTAGIKFDFSREYIKELAGFIKSELEFLH